MSDAPASRLSVKDVLGIAIPAAGLCVLVSGTLRADGGRDKQIDDNTRRIEQLEARDNAKTDLLRTIDGRTIRIETKLELIVPSKGSAHP